MGVFKQEEGLRKGSLCPTIHLDYVILGQHYSSQFSMTFCYVFWTITSQHNISQGRDSAHKLPHHSIIVICKCLNVKNRLSWIFYWSPDYNECISTQYTSCIIQFKWQTGNDTWWVTHIYLRARKEALLSAIISTLEGAIVQKYISAMSVFIPDDCLWGPISDRLIGLGVNWGNVPFKNMYL